MNHSKEVAEQFLRIQRAKDKLRTALYNVGVPTEETDTLDDIASKVEGYTLPSRIPINRESFLANNVDMVIAPPLRIDKTRHTNINYAFSGCTKLKRLPDIENMGEATSMYEFAKLCASLEEAHLPDLPNVQSLSGAFSRCPALRQLTIGALTKLTIMIYFADNSGLEEITLPACPELTKMTYAFDTCRSLKRATLGLLPRLADATYLFSNCESLTEVTLAGFGETTNLANWGGMFANCPKLERVNGVIDLTSNATQGRYGVPFAGCTALKEVRIKGLPHYYDFRANPLLSDESITFIVENLAPKKGGKPTQVIFTREMETRLGEDKSVELEDKATELGWSLTWA